MGICIFGAARKDSKLKSSKMKKKNPILFSLNMGEPNAIRYIGLGEKEKENKTPEPALYH